MTGGIAARLAEVRAELAAACARRGRDPGAVAIIAVTKNQEPAALDELRAAGLRDFGENRIEHLLRMRAASVAGDRWHFIGRIQGRQLAALVGLCDVLHSLASPDHVVRLARACREGGRRLPVYIQVNASGEASKSGVAPADLPDLLARVRAEADALEPLGLMTMAPEIRSGTAAEIAAVRACFAAVSALASTCGLAGLSMGMSGDAAIAAEEGATTVRIGSRLFA